MIASAAIIQLSSPAEITCAATTINFDGFPDRTIANTLFQEQGIVFSRDDGFAIPILNWADLGRVTKSPPNVIATIAGNFQGQPVPFVTHLNASFTKSIFELGAFFGNDQGFGGYTETTLSVFDSNDVSLGSVSISTNNNTSVDQFIGLASTAPFFSARFENNGTDLSVVLDDVKFATQVPEPPTWSRITGWIAFMCLLWAERWFGARKERLPGRMRWDRRDLVSFPGARLSCRSDLAYAEAGCRIRSGSQGTGPASGILSRAPR